MSLQGAAYLNQPYSGWGPDELLAYMRRRSGVRYFPVIPDPSDVSREKMDAILTGEYEFNGEVHRITGECEWTRNPSQDIEWFILWHKFYYAPGLGLAYQETRDRRYLDQWVRLTDGWVQSVPLDLLPSDVAGRRIQNWIYAHYYFVTASENAPVPTDFYERFLGSLHAQVNWLRNHLTPARNHRTLELCAILLAAIVFPEMQDADEWLAFSKEQLLKNMQSDLLADGVQCELSTDYHHIVLRDFLMARRLLSENSVSIPSEMDTHLRRALHFSKWAHRPDGIVPSFSDGDNGCFLDLLALGHDLYDDKEMLFVATSGTEGRAPLSRIQAFPVSGYYVMRSGWGEGRDRYEGERYLLFDCGPLGAGNHGHFDLLHFEAYAFGRPLIVDPGRYTYHEGAGDNWRVVFRSTEYHNTATVDRANQVRYEFDKTRFKVRGPELGHSLHLFGATDTIAFLSAECRSFQYDAIHERSIVLVRGEYWIISDWLRAPGPHAYDLWFHLSPEAEDRVQCSASVVEAPFLVMALPETSGMEVALEDGFVSPRYGVKRRAPVVRLHQHGTRCVFHTVLVPHKGADVPRVSVATSSEREVEVRIVRNGQESRDVVQYRNSEPPVFEQTMSQAYSTGELVWAR